MATYTRDQTIDTSEDADYKYESIRDLDLCIDGLVRDLNLCHLTTRGDLLVRDGSGATRLAIGTVNQVLTSDGTDVTWQGGCTTLTSDTNIADATHDVLILDGTSNSVTATLPAATATKTYRFKCINLTNACDIACDGSETIEGVATYTFTEPNQCITIRGDTTPATNTWRMIHEHIPRMQDNATHTTSGTDETDMGRQTLNQNAIRAGDVVVVDSSGTMTGTAGNVTVKFYIGATAITVVNNAATAAGDWVMNVVIAFTATNAQRVSIWYQDQAAANDFYEYTTASVDTTAASTALKPTIQRHNGADSATGETFIAQLIRG